MRIDTDWHIHTHCSCDSACMKYETFVQDAEMLGLRDFGVSDHLHNQLQEQDIAASRREYDEILEHYPALKGHFHFGVEASVMSKWELDKIAGGNYSGTPKYGIRTGGPAEGALALVLNDEFMEKYKIEYVVTGIHWPMYCQMDRESIFKDHHRQYFIPPPPPHCEWCAMNFPVFQMMNLRHKAVKKKSHTTSK